MFDLETYTLRFREFRAIGFAAGPGPCPRRQFDESCLVAIQLLLGKILEVDQ